MSLFCPVCHADLYHNADTRILYATGCDHSVCARCVAQMFSGARRRSLQPCPHCKRSLSLEDFVEDPKEGRQVRSETSIRKQILQVYCKTQADFPAEDLYNDYLEEREDIILKLTGPSSQAEVQEAWRQVEAYKQKNQEQILRSQGAQTQQKARRIQSIIDAEGSFYSRVNAEWREGGAADMMQHPFKERYKEVLAKEEEPQAMATDDAGPGPAEAIAPQPLFQDRHDTDRRQDTGRHMSGGGAAADAYVAKAEYFFFQELADSMPFLAR